MHSYPERWRERPCETSATYWNTGSGVVRIPTGECLKDERVVYFEENAPSHVEGA